MSRVVSASLTAEQFEYLLDLPGGASVRRVSVEAGEVVLHLSVEGGVADDWDGSVSLEYADDGEGHLLLVGASPSVTP